MAITSVTISQSNVTSSINLLSIHNPLVFIVDAEYTGSTPTQLNVKIYDDDDVLLNEFACIPYSDVTGLRQFVFIATDILKAYMGEIDDFRSSEKALEYVDGITKVFNLIFYDPVDEEEDEVTFTAMHACRQFGDTPYLESIQTNEDETYYAAVGMPVYCYIYNDDEENVLTVNAGEIIPDVLLDYDDVALVDYDDIYLTSDF
jgi:hypothetical protein